MLGKNNKVSVCECVCMRAQMFVTYKGHQSKSPFETVGSLKDCCASSVILCSLHTGQLEQGIIVVPPLTQQHRNTQRQTGFQGG